MRRHRLRPGDDAVSPVIGVVLLVAIAVTMMAAISVFVLGFGPGDSPPRGDVNFEQDSLGGGDKAVNVTVTEANDLREEEVVVKIDGDRACDGSSNPAWDGQGDLEPGDRTRVEEVCDGGAPIQEGDTVQVIWESDSSSQSEILAEYELFA